MTTIEYPDKETWESHCLRPTLDTSRLEETVAAIFSEVREKGDLALLNYSKAFDNVLIDTLQVDLDSKKYTLDPSLQQAIKIAKNNIEKFHAIQSETPTKIETSKGVVCWRKSLPIQNVGLYIPGGTAPLFSTLLMLAIPAKLAGCQHITVCTPPNKSGELDEVMGWVCQLLEIENVFLCGGAQAIAAMTFGTESIARVDKLFGPGNQYVTSAKQMAQKYGVTIDMPAGPSELLVIADESAYPSFVAADLLSQAEHGDDSQVILVSNSKKMLARVKEEINVQKNVLPRSLLIEKALENSKCILLADLDECIAFSNTYAPEHLIISTENAEQLGDKISSAGSVFLGNWSCESAGDYASGTNHTLPTNGYARNYSGVSLDSFVKKITFQKISQKGIENLGASIQKMAEAEKLEAHKNAVRIRLEQIKNR